MIQLTYSDIIIATQLANYLAETLDSSSYKTRTAKTISHLVRNGSKTFRKSLRNRDEILRKIANCSDPLVAKILKDTRTVLFDEELVNKDDSDQPETCPKPTLSGMGASSGGKGFGNAPVNKENLGHKVLDIIDKVTNIPDERAEVLKMCLENSPTGSYEPVPAPALTKSVMLKTSTTSLTSSTNVIRGKKHKPGKAGGGWESSDDEDIGQSLSEVSLTSPVKDLMLDSAWYVTF